MALGEVSAASAPLLVPSAHAAQAPGPSPRNVKRGGTLVASTSWTYPTMDPHISTMGAEMLGCGAMFNGLVRLELVDANTWEHKLVGDLAESWEQPDLSTLVFKLKSGVTFPDGSPFTADVAAWNLFRCRDHPKSFLISQMANLASVEAAGKTTLRLKFKSPNAGFLRGWPSCNPCPRWSPRPPWTNSARRGSRATPSAPDRSGSNNGSRTTD